MLLKIDDDQKTSFYKVVKVSRGARGRHWVAVSGYHHQAPGGTCTHQVRRRQASSALQVVLEKLVQIALNGKEAKSLVRTKGR